MTDTPDINSLLEETRKRLVETGTRNRLIHVNREARRSNSVNIINERSDNVFEILCKNGRTMSFLASGAEPDEDADPQGIILAEEDNDFDEARYTDSRLETPLTENDLQKRLLRMAREARTLEQEQGINILYLAMGFLEWYEDESSSVKREAPLILIPADLVRNERSHRYDLKFRGDDPVGNLPLYKRLREDFGTQLPELPNADISDIMPSSYFAKVRNAVSMHPRWQLDENGMQLGFFSYSKLLMYADLDPDAWPESQLDEQSLISGLLQDNITSEPDLFAPDEFLDDRLQPQDLLHVVNADASQTRVIEEVRSGRNLVVQGPPGTGKSQTITNILAGAAAEGKKVLFVAEKMAALEVVYRRMQQAGLRDLCLQLHSRKTNKKAFWTELKNTLDKSSGSSLVSNDAADLQEARDELNAVARALHSPLDGKDYTPFSAIASLVRMVGRNIDPPKIRVRDMESFSQSKTDDCEKAITKFQEKLRVTGTEHPFAWVRNHRLQPTDERRLGPDCGQAAEQLDELLQGREQLLQRLPDWQESTLQATQSLLHLLQSRSRMPRLMESSAAILFAHRDSEDLSTALQLAADWIKTRSELDEKFQDAAYETSITEIRRKLAKGSVSFFARIFGGYRSAGRELQTLLKLPLPRQPDEQLALADLLLDAQQKLRAFTEEEAFLKSQLADIWRGRRTPFAELLACLAWLQQVLSDLPELTLAQLQACIELPESAEPLAEKIRGFCSEADASVARLFSKLEMETEEAASYDRIDLAVLRDRLNLMSRNTGRYAEWADFVRAGSDMTRLGLDHLMQLLVQEKIPLDRALDEFRYALAERQWAFALQVRPELSKVANMDRSSLVDRFRKLDRERISLVQDHIRTKHLDGLPKGTDGEMGFIRGQAARKSRHSSIRGAMEHAGDMIQRIKPVFLMSPISVSQFLPPGKIEFDLLVMDEASQVRPEDAFGSIARARQIVVVGDQKQLPPTAFFDRLTSNDMGEEEEDDPTVIKVGEMESILHLCDARGLKQSMLEWHYRSQHPSLIQVSNKEFYQDRLILPLSPFQKDPNLGLKFKRVPGVYAKRGSGAGRQGTNRIEADAIAEHIAEHAHAKPRQSLGVIAFSKVQADMITEVLELARRRDPTLDVFLRDSNQEEVFVKNIENVQGDERDVILISVGYGPHEAGGRLASMNFGPVNADGGERRLNVMFSRARYLCEVFCSFDPGDIDTRRVREDRFGPRILKTFLKFAESGILEQKVVTGGQADSPFEEDVAHEIRRLGFEVEHQVGTAGFLVDLGVRNPDRPGQYILAVECDGASYHGSLSARERDRQRQEILEGFGWVFHRIWSTDWFKHRGRELERLQKVLQAAREQAAEGPEIRGANKEKNMSPQEEDPPEAKEPAPEPEGLSAPLYAQADLTVTIKGDAEALPHEFPAEQMAKVVQKIVEFEGPLHQRETARRVATAFGVKQAGARIQNASSLGLAFCAKHKLLIQDGDFWMTQTQLEQIPIRDRSEEKSPTNRPEYIYPGEIRAAAELIIRESGKMSREELLRATAKLLGYKRVTQKLKDVLADALGPEDG